MVMRFVWIGWPQFKIRIVRITLIDPRIRNSGRIS